MSRSHARLLMIFSALLMFGIGLAFTFAPAEIAGLSGGSRVPFVTALAQVCGALYLGFAILNWMAKDNLIGGIYSRPVAMGNFLHFFVSAMALIKSLPALPRSPAILALVAAYAILAIGFGTVLFRPPKTD